MTIYLDLLFILNLFYDMLIFITLDCTLKRRCCFRKILLASILSALSSFSIILNNNIIIISINIIVGVSAVLILFGYKNIKYTLENLAYLYMISVILAGFLYFLSIYFKNANYILLLLTAPIVLFIYVKEQKGLREKINYEKLVTIIFKNNKSLTLTGFIDTGNRLRDPITKKYVILIHKDKLKGIYNIRSPIYVPAKTINKNSLISCTAIKDLIIDDKHFNNYLVGISEAVKSSSECLLNYHLLEEL